MNSLILKAKCRCKMDAFMVFLMGFVLITIIYAMKEM